jgi:hypothetical protein
MRLRQWFFRFVLRAKRAHEWSAWHIEERGTTGLMAAFGSDFVSTQQRSCHRCGLTQETTLSIDDDISCTDDICT